MRGNKGSLMSLQALLYLLPYIISVLLCAGVGIYALSRRMVAGAMPFAWTALLPAISAVANITLNHRVSASLSPEQVVETALVATAESVKPDLVILDILMPRLDGWRTLQKIREVSSVPILLLTTLEEANMGEEGLARGADGCLTKPVDTQDLHTRARDLVQGRAARV